MTKPNVIALDPATTCGCAVGPVGGKPALSSIVLGEANDTIIDVFGRAARTVHEMIERYSPVLIAVEQPFYKSKESNYATTMLLHGLYGAITGAARARMIRVLPVAVSTWRSSALGTAKFGSRKAAKQAMLSLCAQLGWPASDDNAADAAGIWMWATATYAPFGVLPEDYSKLLTG
jgi:Holliday junction resolvasome RuvABC endonuclease subunit